MNKEKFWELIEEVKQSCKDNLQDMAPELEKRLSEYSVKDVQKFCGIYDTYHTAMNSPGMISIAHLMNHEMLTDDGFIDFRNWLIAQGKEVFMKTMENPEFLAEYPGQSIDGWYEFEIFGYVGTKVIENKTGNYKLAHKRLSDTERNRILQEIKFGDFIDKDMSLEEMKHAFPKFTEKFIKENEEYDLEGRLAEIDFGI